MTTDNHPDDNHQADTFPIPESAVVLRRIHRNDVDESLAYPILDRAFRPSPVDTDGLSVYLDEDHGGPSPADLAASGRGGPVSYYVVALRVGDLRAIGLDVVAVESPDGLPGHAVIPELNVGDYQSSRAAKRRQKVLQSKLSRLACNRIVYRPEQVSH